LREVEVEVEVEGLIVVVDATRPIFFVSRRVASDRELLVQLAKETVKCTRRGGKYGSRKEKGGALKYLRISFSY
jgi:hypothetical protein